MKKITNFTLGAIGVIGAYLVSEGLITGEELTSIQNVVGLILGGGALSIGLIIAIINAIPNQLVNLGYKKAVDVYGEDKVNGALNTTDNILAKLEQQEIENAEIKELLNTLNAKLDKAEQTRQQLLE